jgi:hypothetical protein
MTISVPSRFNGPTSSGNGGYACGVLAAHFDGPAAVSLRRPGAARSGARGPHQQSEIVTAPRASVTYVAVGRVLERSGRKGLAATAILTDDGTVLAHSELLVVVPRG